MGHISMWPIASMGQINIGLYPMGPGGSGTKCRTSRRLSVVLDIFH